MPMQNGSLGRVLSCKAMLPAQHGEEGVKKTTDSITSLTSGKAVVNSRHDKLELTEDDPDVIVIDDLPENENIVNKRG